MSKKKSKLELLGELFPSISGKGIIISGNIEDFAHIKQESDNFGSSKVSYTISNNSEKEDRFSICYNGNTFHFVDSSILQNLFNEVK